MAKPSLPTSCLPGAKRLGDPVLLRSSAGAAIGPVPMPTPFLSHRRRRRRRHGLARDRARHDGCCASRPCVGAGRLDQAEALTVVTLVTLVFPIFFCGEVSAWPRS